MERLIINSITREKRFAYLKNEKLERLYIEQPHHQSLVGSIFLGIVEKVIPGMNAAFVHFGEEKSGFLSRDKVPAFVLDPRGKEEKAKKSISSYLHQGEKILVQVEKDAAGTKGARLTGIIELEGSALIYMPAGKYTAVSKKITDDAERERWRTFGQQIKTAEEGLIFRTAVTSYTVAEIQMELTKLRERYKLFQAEVKNKKKPGLLASKDFFLAELQRAIENMKSGEVIVDDLTLKKQLERYGGQLEIKYVHQKENIFSVYGLEKELERAMKKVVWLEHGAYLIFDETEALTIIDVNTGKYSGKNDLQETVVKTNLLAAKEIARQLRLRDLGGMILIDFIDMKNHEDQEAVLKTIETALAKDKRRTRIVGFTELGILQLTRKKTKLALSEALNSPCSVCHGTGKVLSAESIAFRLERELWEYRNTDHQAVFVAATNEVINVFSGENDVHRKRLEEAIGLSIFWKEMESAKPAYQILQLGTKEEMLLKAD